MRNLQNYLIPSILLLFTVSGCATRQPVQVVTEYSQIPTTFQQVPEIPSVPQGDEITVGEGIELSNRLRIAVCTYHSRYRELLRYATQGKVVLSAADKNSCPR